MRKAECCRYLTEHAYHEYYCEIKNRPVVRNCYKFCNDYYPYGKALADKIESIKL